jgi:hypothetical protein
MTEPQRPTPFSDSQRAQIERIKAIKAAEREERLRREAESLWRECYDQGWVTEALEMQQARDDAREAEARRARIAAHNELERVRAEVLEELSADD